MLDKVKREVAASAYVGAFRGSVAVRAPGAWPGGRRRVRGDPAGSGQRAQDGGVALAATAAERDGCGGGPAAAQLEQRGQREPRARHADGVAQRDGAAVDVDLVLVDAEVVDRGEADGGEGLVDLEEVDGTEVNASLAGCLDHRPRRLGQQRVVRAGHHAGADD